MLDELAIAQKIIRNTGVVKEKGYLFLFWAIAKANAIPFNNACSFY